MESKRRLPVLADELLEEIFLRIACPADLARASTACASFRRLIAGPAFLRRYRKLHPPLLLGFFHFKGFQLVETPHPGPGALATRALAQGADFSLDYLPRAGGAGGWYARDVRDGRVLFESRSFLGPVTTFRGLVLPDLAVCDPVYRQYLLLPPIPDGLLATVQVQQDKRFQLQTLLVSSGNDDDETSFRVIGWVPSQTNYVFVFSSASGAWTATSTNGDALGGLHPRVLGSPQYACGCFYWKVRRMNKLLKLDVGSMELSILDLPRGHISRDVVITELGEGRLGMFSLRESLHYYTMMRDDGNGANQWQMKSKIPLPLPASHYPVLMGAAEGHVFLLGVPKVSSGPKDGTYFSLEAKTLEIKRIGETRNPVFTICPYFGFPPSMTPRRI